ncbi:MAG: cysteine--tRNA ligase [Candidatus Omnitrophica bacterium]|nr:cysteine--tRNA ligase [Candidatus Omnitrophota bacterium]
MALQFFDTLSRAKREFEPLQPKKVSLYVCGVTVYDHCHVGHARGAVVFDVLRRYLQHKGYEVTHVRNITDVDDKIIDRARSESSGDLTAAAAAVARRYEQSFREDFSKLDLLPPTQEPKATEFIPKMIQFVGKLVQAGYAYEGADGVYFSVRKLNTYGQLSHQRPDQMMAGVRIDPGEGKREPLDFALWKKAKPEEPSWPSPWGEGRPGWHIECSTMSTDILGDTFDIHGGGQDLIFPHHENERAQALGAGKKFANYWLHNGLLTVNGQKMSKSVGNIISIQDVLKKHSADVLRMFFLSAHYKSPQDFTWERLEEAASGYETIRAFLAHAGLFGKKSGADSSACAEAETKFHAAMEDDLNTPKALAALHDLRSEATHGKIDPVEAAAMLWRLVQILGFFQSISLAGGISSGESVGVPALIGGASEEVKKLLAERDKARKRKDFATSDKIRKQLTEMGYIVEDTSGQTVVRKKA